MWPLLPILLRLLCIVPPVQTRRRELAKETNAEPCSDAQVPVLSSRFFRRSTMRAENGASSNSSAIISCCCCRSRPAQANAASPTKVCLRGTSIRQNASSRAGEGSCPIGTAPRSQNASRSLSPRCTRPHDACSLPLSRLLQVFLSHSNAPQASTQHGGLFARGQGNIYKRTSPPILAATFGAVGPPPGTSLKKARYRLRHC